MLPVELTPDIDRTDHEYPTGARNWPNEAQTRMLEQTANYIVDDPIKQGADTPARPARMPVIFFTAINWIHSFMEEHPKLVWDPPQQWVQQAYGIMQPFQERSNIAQPSHIAYGSLFEMNPQQYESLR